MAAGSWTLTNNTRTYLLDGTFDLNSDTFKIALFTSASNIGAASTTYAGLTGEVASGNGYTTGGNSVTGSLSGTTTVTFDTTDPAVWTGSGAGFSARYAVLYEVSGNVLAYFLLDSTPADVTVTAGNTLTISVANVFSLA